MHGCTITTSRYAAHARVLAESFLAHNPGARFAVLAIDGAPRTPTPDGERRETPASTGEQRETPTYTRDQRETRALTGKQRETPASTRERRETPASTGEQRLETLAPADIGIDAQELSRRATVYPALGLACSLKPNLMLALLARGYGPVLFLDADSCVYGDLTHVAELAQRHSLVLSPHSPEEHPLWRVSSPEQEFIRAGVMNAGFLGAGGGARAFLQWWAERTARRCLLDAPHGLLLDQTWLTFAMALFEHHVLRDRGCNVAGWNLHTRDVQWEGDAPRIDGEPLRHFHFACGYDPEHPERLTAQEHAHWWPTLQERPGVARLSREYAERLIAHGHREARAKTQAFDALPGGGQIEPRVRAVYREALLEAELDGAEEPPNPFSDGEPRFHEWLVQRASEHLESQPAAMRGHSGEPGDR
ncbi:MAG TPA: hypothetical protein VNY52_02990 [Solirubrobacteraceae bacterium]|jgi:hypothetical protein|nr:hypothetical protein [Solirubrobacteraceae bacterium]